MFDNNQPPGLRETTWDISRNVKLAYDDVTMSLMASQITSLTIVDSTVYSGADQRKHQSSASLAFVRGIHRGPVNSPHKWPATRKMFPLYDVIMSWIFGFGHWTFECLMSNIEYPSYFTFLVPMSFWKTLSTRSVERHSKSTGTNETELADYRTWILNLGRVYKRHWCHP